MITGRKSQDPVPWTDELPSSLYEAQRAISKSRTVTLPRPDDQLWIVTDGAVRSPDIEATLYVTRGQKLHLAAFFIAKLRGTKSRWLPCEVEALSIGVATRHFGPFLIQSQHKGCILTNSKPCVQAYEKLCRGEFSTSTRVSTFLSTVSRYQVSVRHVAGSAILPSDFASRNAPSCEDQSCQVCSFVQRLEECVVRRVPIQDILNGLEKLPFTSRPAWLSIQSECADLRRIHAHLKQGTNVRKFTGSQLRSSSYRVKLSECYRVPDQTETSSKFSLRYSAVLYPEDINEEPLTSVYVDENLTHVPTPQSTSNLAPSLVPGELATSPDPYTDTSLYRSVPRSSMDAGPRRSSRSTRSPAYLKDYVT